MAPVMVGNSLPINKRLKELLVGLKWEHMAAGVSGGVMSTLVLHPLDLVKIRFQVNEGLAISTARPQYSGIANALVTIGRKEGLRGLYQGVTPNVWGAGASWGLYFFFYNAVKSRKLKKENLTVLSPGAHMLAAAEAGVFTLIITNPMWVAKTRLCLQYDRYTKGSAQYKGFADCLAKIYRQEGIRGWYKGFVPGMFGVSHGAIQFMTYEEMKKGYNKYKQQPLDAKFSTLEYLTFAALSKICAACTTYPYQVVRSRLQDQHRHYNGIGDVIKQVWRVEGWRGYYKGMSPYLVHVTPNICIVFLLYESITRFAKEHRARVKAEIAAERERIHQLQSLSSQCSTKTVQSNEEEILDLSDMTNKR